MRKYAGTTTILFFGKMKTIKMNHLKYILILLFQLLFENVSLAQIYNDGYIKYGDIVLTDNEKWIINQYLSKAHQTPSFDNVGKMLIKEFNEWNLYTDAQSGKYHYLYTSLQYAAMLLDLNDKFYEPKAFEVINKCLYLQEKDTTRSYYGVFPYYEEEPLRKKISPVDYNMADFNAVTLIDIYISHKNRIPAELLNKINNAIILSCKQIQKRDIRLSYTNIHIMGTYCTYICAYLFNIPAMKDYARKRLKMFYDYTMSKGGFTEYNSPAYSFTALDELQRMKNNIVHPDDRMMIDSLYNLQWSIISRHYHTPSGQWSAPHSRTYENFMQSGQYGIIKQATNGVVNLGYEPSRGPYVKIRHQLPSYLYSYYLKPVYPRTEMDVFEPAEPQITGTTYLTNTYSIGTTSRSCLWNQRRPFMAYWGVKSFPKCLQVRFLHDFYDFSSACIFTTQKDSMCLTNIVLATNGGDKHISADLTNGSISATDLRIRFEFSNCTSSQIKLPDSVNLLSQFNVGGMNFMLQMYYTSFGTNQAKWEKGENYGSAWLDLVIYSGATKTFNLKTIASAIWGFTFSMGGGNPVTEVPVYSVLNGQLNTTWKGLLLSSPVKPTNLGSNL